MVGLVGLVGEGVTEEEMVDLGRGRGRGLGVGIFANNPKKEKKKSLYGDSPYSTAVRTLTDLLLPTSPKC